MGTVAERFPWLFASRRFLFGLVEIPRWGYECGYSNAYIELLCVDCTIHDYKTKEKKERRDGISKYTASDVEDTMRRWEEMKKKRKNDV